MWQTIHRLLRESLGEVEALALTPISGAQNHTWHLRYRQHEVFVKSDPHEMLLLFIAEAGTQQYCQSSLRAGYPDHPSPIYDGY